MSSTHCTYLSEQLYTALFHSRNCRIITHLKYELPLLSHSHANNWCLSLFASPASDLDGVQKVPIRKTGVLRERERERERGWTIEQLEVAAAAGHRTALLDDETCIYR